MNNYKKIFLFLIVWFIGIGFWANVFAEDQSDLYVSNLSDVIFNDWSFFDFDSKDKKFIISHFCDKVLASDAFVYNDGFYYNPRQSLFMLTLCSETMDDYENVFQGNFIFESEEKSYMSGHYLEKFALSRSWSCNPNVWFMGKCDLFNVVPDMFDRIIGEYVSLKHAGIYGLQTDKTDNWITEEEQANVFSEKWFSLKLCELDEECLYPNTMKRMKNYLRQSRRLLGSVKFVNYDNILAEARVDVDKANSPPASEYLCTEPQKQKKDISYNIVMCGLYTTYDKTMKSFLNLLYNELLYYRMFVSYYSALLKYNTAFEKTVSGKPKYGFDNNKMSNINKLNTKYSWSEKAIVDKNVEWNANDIPFAYWVYDVLWKIDVV